MMQRHLIYVIAGEASGDVLGARLIASMRARHAGLDFTGIGGARMAEIGVESLFPVDDLAVMGFLEVLPRLRVLRARLAQTIADITTRKPAVVITIDAPGFALRVLRAIAPLGIKRVHYVAPQVWAWKEKRVKTYPGLWDRLLCLLPFEPEFFARHGLAARFVGHPVLESGADRGDAARFRARFGIGDGEAVLLAMPGSRRGELKRHLPVFGAAVRLLESSLGERKLRVAIAAAPGLEAEIRRTCRNWTTPPVIVSTLEDKHDCFAAADAALTKSGTSSLELALARVPMAVAYRVNPLTAVIARRLIKVKFASLVNLLAGREVVPELIQQDCTAEKLAGVLGALLSDPDSAAAQRAAFVPILRSLRPAAGLPSEEAARAVLELLDAR